MPKRSDIPQHDSTALLLKLLWCFLSSLPCWAVLVFNCNATFYFLPFLHHVPVVSEPCNSKWSDSTWCCKTCTISQQHRKLLPGADGCWEQGTILPRHRSNHSSDIHGKSAEWVKKMGHHPTKAKSESDLVEEEWRIAPHAPQHHMECPNPSVSCSNQESCLHTFPNPRLRALSVKWQLKMF